MAKAPSPQTCIGCGLEFPSRNSFFKHLRDTDGACLSGDEYIDFCQNHLKHHLEKGNKVLILFGYIPTTITSTITSSTTNGQQQQQDDVEGRGVLIRNGDDAAILLLQAIQQWQDQVDGIGTLPPQHPPLPQQQQRTYDTSTMFKYSRSYGNSQRAMEVVAQDNDTGAITEVIATKLRPLRGGLTVDTWLDQVQAILEQRTSPLGSGTTVCPVRILGRQEVQNNSKFNAEIDVSQRRVEYFLPVEAISWNAPPGIKAKLERLSPFSDSFVQHIDDSCNDTDEETRIYLFKLKKLMQTLTTGVMDLDMNDETAVLQKKSSLQKRKFLTNTSRKKKKEENEENGDQDVSKNDASSKQDEKETKVKITSRHRVLQRKRYHNFTETLMAHEFLAFRRIDRMHHRCTLTFPNIDAVNTRPFIVLSLSGDLFLNGLIYRLVGIFLALANNLIDKDIVDCLFDEDYPHLVPTPCAPSCGMVAAEARYMTWEGKLKCILSARMSDRFPTGWNNQSTLDRCRAWQDIVHQHVARQWLSKGRNASDGRVVKEKEWTENVLLPWVVQAKRHLEEYREWRQKRQDLVALSELPAASLDEKRTDPSTSLILESVNDVVPEAFRKVLYHLRKLDESGQWPATTPKRQLVMVSTEEHDDAKQAKTTSLSLARLKARSNNAERSSAYVFAEGQGGASGSFSVGLMPGVGSKPPKANYLFPELVAAAFELERVLCPDREPSSTIAINRNAQFRPHTDSGAGAGQSTSLIVGLGTYSGGELMVEGEKCDIRYKAIEFDGWKQRHWTLPFIGERYSLVWFTPKGCEGMRGIDLELSTGLAATATDSRTMDSQ
jgi:tRNA U38,U39,U40 pseudouridine synthase TruA